MIPTKLATYCQLLYTNKYHSYSQFIMLVMFIPKDRFNQQWGLVAICTIILIVLPFILLFIEQTREFILNFIHIIHLSENDFLSLWITFWGVIVAICGLYQIKVNQGQLKYTQKQLETSQAQVKVAQNQLTADMKFYQESLNQQQKQIALQTIQIAEERFSFLKKSINSNDAAIQLDAVDELFDFAIQHNDKYKHSICRLFCSLIRTSKTIIDGIDGPKVPEHIERMIQLLFSAPYPFDKCSKNLTSSLILGVSIRNAKINNASFSGSRITNCIIHHSHILECTFSNVHMDSCLLKTTTIKKTDFQNCSFSKVAFNKTHIINLIFSKSKIHNSILGNCRIMKVNFEDTEIKDTLFSKIKFSDRCNLESCKISNTIFSFPNIEYKDNFKPYLSQLHLSNSNEEGNIIKID